MKNKGDIAEKIRASIAERKKINAKIADGFAKAAATPQPPPEGDGAPVLPMVVADIMARAEMGFKKYGTLLKTDNGRDALVDAYQEAIDLVMYLRQLIAERDGKKGA